MKNLWILTEERPKLKVLQMILGEFSKDMNCGFFCDTLRIIPILDENKCFKFIYELIGFKCSKINHIYIKTVSGNSSFVDFLIYHQDNEPKPDDIPFYCIEETKTDDKESRNTGVFQRCSKFVYLNHYYPQSRKIMLYSLEVEQKKKPTETYIFGTRLLLTYGVEILGKKLDPNVFKPFNDIDEIVSFKNNMKLPPKNNVPILINKTDDKIQISGRLIKYDRLGHDPNIGSLSIISSVLRQFGWDKQIEITRHGLEQRHVLGKNKFIQICNLVDITLEGLTIPKVQPPKNYWKYENQGEKLGTIFIHLVVENFTESYSIFENHAGCEKGYFFTSDGTPLPLHKYKDRIKYKQGDKSQKISIPDLVLLDLQEYESITIEGKKWCNMDKGIRELQDYGTFEDLYLKKYYPKFKPIRTVVLYGSKEESLVKVEVGFLLNKNGKLVLGIKCPKLFSRSIERLLDYWN